MAVWPVHGSYSGRCGRCVIYTDPPRYASNRPLYLRDAIPILNTELGVRVTLVLILILSLSLRVAVRKDCIIMSHNVHKKQTAGQLSLMIKFSSK